MPSNRQSAEEITERVVAHDGKRYHAPRENDRLGEVFYEKTHETRSVSERIRAVNDDKRVEKLVILLDDFQ